MKKRNNMRPKWRQPLQPPSQEREEWWDQTMLKMYRKILGNPNMTVEEMKEMNNRKQDNTTEVTFLKNGH